MLGTEAGTIQAKRHELSLKVLHWMNVAFRDKNLDLEDISVRDFVCILLDIILYENATLVNHAFKLLVRFFSQKKAIIELAEEVQLLEDPAEIAILSFVSQELPEVKKDAENSEFWLGFEDHDGLCKARKVMDKFDMFSDLCVQ